MSQPPYDGVAIVGLAGRFPGARTVEQFWANLVAGRESISFFDDADLRESGLDADALRRRGRYVAARGVIEDADRFDAAFFGINQREAEVIDPQHRIFLEMCWTALEHAGYAPDRVPNVVGVFGGVTFNTYYQHVLHERRDLKELVGAEMVMFGNEKDYLATRVAYKLGLTGPAVNVSTACSTSLVAVCQACHALQAYQCDTALAGGASVTVPQKRGYYYDDGNIGSADGHTRTFDEKSAGTVFSNGVGVVVLKRLEDAVRDGDRIYAVIKGAAINNDGSQRVSFGAPGVQGQSDAIAMAHALAGVDPGSITYVEAHGTATPLGDPIELAGLTRAFRLGTDKRQYCAIGSVKTNIGHLDAASGVAGLIKTALALHHRVIPASLHFTRPNPKLELESSPFFVNSTLREWTTGGGAPRRAGVSSFGTGGTNAHVVIEEGPVAPSPGASRPEQLLVLSARTADALERTTDNLAAHLRNLAGASADAGDAASALADTAFTLQTGRSPFDHRRIVVCADPADGAEALAARDAARIVTMRQRLVKPPVVFMFPGQGAQYPGMGAGLYRTEAIFRSEVDRCASLLEPVLGLDLRTVMFPARGSEAEAEQQLIQTRLTQPALFVIEYALARLWMAWGIEPAAMIGHSVGEYVAACLAGVFTLEDALSLVARRGALVQSLPGGAMLAVRLPERDLLPLLSGGLAIAAVNAPGLSVVSGAYDAIAALEADLARRDVAARRLSTSHAFHSPMMDPAVEPFTEMVRHVALGEPRIPFVSNVTARWITEAEAKSPEYWAGHLREAVRFADGVAELATDERRVLLEVGPGQTLATLAKQHPRRSADQTVLASMPSRDQEPRGLLDTLGRLWLAGVEIDWRGFYAGEQRRRAALPTYPFERTRCWPEPAKAMAASPATAAAAACQAPAVDLHYPPQVSAAPVSEAPLSGIPRRARLLGEVRVQLEHISGMSLADADPSTPFVALGLDSLLLTQVGSKLRSHFGVRVSFRQLMEELSCLDALAGHLDDVLPREVETPAAPAKAIGPSPISATAPGQAPVASAAAAIEALLAQQQAITNQVLDLVRHQPAAPAMTTSSATRGATVTIDRAPSHAASTRAEAPVSGTRSSGPILAIDRTATTLDERQQAFLDALVARYTARTKASKAHTQSSRAHFADPRTMAGFRACWKELVYPLVIERSSGSRMWDLDGNEYIDFTMGFGTNLLGHSPAFVTAAIEEQLKKGIEVGPQTPLAGKVAALMCKLTGMERCAFANTGSEAVLASIRIARTVTGRTRIVYFTGDYHGIFDEVMQRAIGGAGEQRLMAAAPGIPVQPSEHVLILPHNRPESIDAIRAAGDEIAAVIVEPVQSRYPDLQPRDFLQQLRDVTREIGSALVFDEVITGFRAHPGGVQGLFDIRADMATYGKVIGGGMPIGAICGSAAYLDALDGGFWQYGDRSIPESGVTFFAGTYVRHPLAMAGAWASLTHLDREGPALQRSLNDRMSVVAAELNAFLVERQAPLHIETFSSFFWVRIDPKATYGNLLFFLLRDKGIHIFDGRLFFLSTAHSEEDVRHLVRAFKESVCEMQAAGFLAGEAASAVARPAALTPSKAPALTSSPAAALTSPPAAVPAAQPAAALIAARPVPAVGPGPAPRAMKFGVYFFGNYDAAFSPDKYQLLLDTAAFADAHGFSAIWIPERHFHPVGGFSPNPAVIAAALATSTRQIALRAGSVVLPLHHPIRVAEEWSVVDNLSKGRVGLSIASGWHPNDFVFAPDAYERRRELCTEGIATIRQLWSGASIAARGGSGNELQVSLFPMPQQRELPLWLTCVQAPSFEKAGELGVGVLAMLTNQTLDEMAGKIALYRRALAAHGHDPAAGNVTLLMHTFVGADFGAAVAKARGPMREYLRSYLDNSRIRHESAGREQDADNSDIEYLLDRSFDDYVNGKSLIGTPETCAATVARLREIGVDELGCFMDFGVAAESVRAGLPFLDDLKRRCEQTDAEADEPSLTNLTAVATGSRVDVPVTLPMTESQQGLSLLSRLAPAGNRAYAEVTTLRLRGPLALDLLTHALQALVDRHEGLRTTIDDTGEQQTVHSRATLDVPLVDLAELADSARSERLASEFAEIEAYAFDFSRAPILRARVFRLAHEHHLLALTFHHVFGNGPSYAVLFRELCDLYDALREGRVPALEPAMQLSEYVRWREQQIGTPEFEQDRAFWHQRFADAMPVLDLPTDRPRPPVMTYRGGRESLTVDAPLTAHLRTASASLRASMFMTLFSAFAVLLHRVSGAEDVVVGTPFEGEAREQPGGEHLVANTTNMIPLRSRIEPAAPFANLVDRTKTLVLEAGEHQSYFFGRLLQDLKVRPDLSRPPMFAASFNVERGAFRRSCGSLDVELLFEDVPFGNPRGASKFELALNIVDTGRELRLDCDYSSDLFDPGTVQRWLGQYRTLLESIAADPKTSVGRLSMLTASERRTIVVEWNDTRVAFPPATTLHELIERQVDRTPLATAVAFEGTTLSYRELDERANRVAHYLRRSGVGPDTLVGICAERSADLMVGLLGILKSGGAYVPIDPEYPKERIAFMLDDAAVGVLLTQRHLVASLPRHDGKTICLDSDWNAIARMSADRPEASAEAGSLAYMIYTSGSTGTPKGALNTHAGIVNRLRWMQDEYTLTAGDSVLQKTPSSFDVSVWELFWPLIAGARVVVARPGGHRDPAYLVQAINRERVTVLHFVPSMLRVFLETPGVASCVSLRDVICSGETLPPEVVETFHATLPATLHNLYGPTEAAVNVTHWRCGRDERRSNIPIGRPIANTQCYILDADLNPVPIGSSGGELHLGGVQVGRGYHRRPQLSAERFIADPFSGAPGARLYKTGDRCRYRSDGTMEYVGRMDHQLKIRGVRIEPGEIEAVLSRHPAVRQCVVVAREDHPGDQRLVAYVESAAPREVVVDAWRAHLASALPEAMIPSAFVILPSLPLTSSGKIDRLALPAPAGDQPARALESAAPQTDTARRLAAIWEVLLGVRPVGLRDDFFRLGGHSLLAMRMVNRVYQEFGVNLPPSALFECPVLADLVERIEPTPLKIVEAPPPVAFAAAPVRTPSSRSLTLSQKVLVQLEAGGAGTPFFWVHGIGGEIFHYMQTSRYLAPLRPVYGFTADWTRMRGFSEPTLDVIAACYVKELRAVQPSGPYHLGGLCAGARLALEMARLLVAAGEQVGVLAAIDCDLEPTSSSPSGVRAVGAFVKNLPHWLREDAQPSGLREVVGRLRSKLRRAGSLVPVRGRGASRTRRADLRDELGMWRFPDYQLPMLELHHRAINTFEPRPFNGRATLFLPRTAPLFGPWPSSYDATWNRVARGGVDVHLVCGSHSTMMSDPFAKEIAERLNEAIAAAERPLRLAASRRMR